MEERIDATNTGPATRRSDAGNWAKPVERLEVGELAPDAVNANVAGRQLAGATGGFGQMWQKTFRARLEGVTATPPEIVRAWKERFEEFGPKGLNRFFWPTGGIVPGAVGVINTRTPGGPTMATGVLVVYADDVSWSYMTPQGHPFTGLITFSVRDDGGTPVAEVAELLRASDPLWELGMMTFVGRKQNEIWRTTLRNLAAHFGVAAEIESRIACVDKRRQWSNAKNVWHNAGIRSGISAPLRLFRRR
jgi:hypothetical protein